MILYLATFIANAAILVFEVAGTRLLAPYLGTSTEVWAGMIAVILGGMSIGYWLGGILADRNPSRKILSAIIFCAGLTALLAWGIRDLIPAALAGTRVLPLTFSSILVALFIFAPTAALLGAVSPFVAKCLLKNMDSSARVIGRVSAISTVGSILGTVLTGAFLVPYFGIDAIMLGTAFLLFALALLVSIEHFFGKILVFGLAFLAAFWINTVPVFGSGLIADVATPYNRILVFDATTEEGSLRALQTDPFGTQCALSMRADGTFDERGIAFGYIRGFEAIARVSLIAVENPKALFLGGCNYSYPRAFLLRHPDASADVVELDPGMIKVAEEYFGFKPESFPSLSIYHEDARRYLADAERKYDIIFMDTFGSASNIPFHLTTKETFALLVSHLAEEGVLVVNIIGARSGPASAFASSMLKTAQTSFSSVSLYALYDAPKPESLQNLLLIASQTTELSGTLYLPDYPAFAIQRTDTAALEPGIVLSDLYAPVEHLTRFGREAMFTGE